MCEERESVSAGREATIDGLNDDLRGRKNQVGELTEALSRIVDIIGTGGHSNHDMLVIVRNVADHAIDEHGDVTLAEQVRARKAKKKARKE